MATVNEKMTAIAEEIRTLSGTTEAMGLDTMASTLNTENANFENNLSTQGDLISQIQSALQNKSLGSSGAQIETCNVTFEECDLILQVGYSYVSANKITSAVTDWAPFDGKPEFTMQNIVKNSCIALYIGDTYTVQCDGGQVLHQDSTFLELAYVKPTEDQVYIRLVDKGV